MQHCSVMAVTECSIAKQTLRLCLSVHEPDRQEFLLKVHRAHGALVGLIATKGTDMRAILLATSFAVSMGVIGLAGISTSQAMPVAPLDQAAAEASVIATTAGGCGWLGHRGPYGHCRPMYSCPPGWHPGPFGRNCYRNY
jgi:hypothetical protein